MIHDVHLHFFNMVSFCIHGCNGIFVESKPLAQTDDFHQCDACLRCQHNDASLPAMQAFLDSSPSVPSNAPSKSQSSWNWTRHLCTRYLSPQVTICQSATLGVSKNRGTTPPNHPFLIGVSIIKFIQFWGITIFGNTQTNLGTLPIHETCVFLHLFLEVKILC